MTPETHEDKDVCKAKHRGAETSVAAHKSVSDQYRYKLRAQILGYFAEDQIGRGLTCDEVEIKSALAHQTVSARISEMLRDGDLRDSGVRRKTRSGRSARVLLLAVKG